MTTQHTATLPDGTIGKRTTASRFYPYCVALSPQPKAELTARLEAEAAEYREQATAYAAVLDYLHEGGPLVEVIADYPGGKGAVYAVDLKPRASSSANERRRGQRHLGLGENRDDIVAKYAEYRDHALGAVVRNETKAAEAEAGPELVGTWGVAGWHGRLYLATKERARVAALYPLRDVVIVETVTVTR